MQSVADVWALNNNLSQRNLPGALPHPLSWLLVNLLSCLSSLHLLVFPSRFFFTFPPRPARHVQPINRVASS